MNGGKVDVAVENGGKCESSHDPVLVGLGGIIRFCRIFGVFPFVLEKKGNAGDENGQERLYGLRLSWPWAAHSAICFIVASGYVAFHAFALGSLIGEGMHFIKLAAQSLWLNAALQGYILVLLLFIRAPQITQVFDQWALFENSLERLFCPVITKQHIRQFVWLYGLVGALSVGMCSVHAVLQPNLPVYPFYFLPKGYFTPLTHGVYVLFQAMMVGGTWIAVGVTEGICCLFASLIRQCMVTLMAGLDALCIQDSVKKIGGNGELESYVQRAIFNMTNFHNISGETDTNKSDHQQINGNSQKEDKISLDEKRAKERYMTFITSKLQTLGVLQEQVNKVMGPMLLIDVGYLVVLSCLLTFLPLRFGGKFDGFSTMTFVGNGVSILSRLVLVIVQLGGVYSDANQVNSALARALIFSKLSAASQGPVLAHLSVYSANPVAFSAWDFFLVTRGTLLAALSLISTYAVVFLQINF